MRPWPFWVRAGGVALLGAMLADGGLPLPTAVLLILVIGALLVGRP
jgi:hypothetical protein